MNSNGGFKRFVFRALRALLILVLLLVVALALVVRHAYRDRHPGYTVDVRIKGSPTNTAPFRVGFHRVNINPDVSNPAKPVYIAGFDQNRVATGIHDDLWAVGCVMDDGKTRLGIVALDSIGFFHDDVIEVRNRIKSDLKLDYVVVCSTHNHSTPDLMGLWGPNFHTSGVDKDYLEKVIQAAATAVSGAVTNLQPARAAFHEIPTPPEGLVRDSRLPIVFDPDLRVIHFTKPGDGQTIGTLTGWADHPETPWSENKEITADFPGYIRDMLAAGIIQDGKTVEKGLGGTHIFVNGAVGGLMTTSPSVTVTNLDNTVLYSKPSHEKARALGQRLTIRILQSIAAGKSQPEERLPISIHARTIELPMDNHGFLLAPILKIIDRGHVRWQTLRSEMALLQVGEASFACIPGEIYPELVNGGIEKAPGGDFGIEPLELPPIRAMMPGRLKFIFGLANDEIGYIIPKSEWDRQPPYIYDAKKSVYGEVNSVGPETANILHDAIKALCEQAK